jgi:hypothetical protein
VPLAEVTGNTMSRAYPLLIPPTPQDPLCLLVTAAPATASAVSRCTVGSYHPSLAVGLAYDSVRLGLIVKTVKKAEAGPSRPCGGVHRRRWQQSFSMLAQQGPVQAREGSRPFQWGQISLVVWSGWGLGRDGWLSL